MDESTPPQKTHGIFDENQPGFGKTNDWQDIYRPAAIKASQSIAKRPILLGKETKRYGRMRRFLKDAVSYLMIPRFIGDEAWRRFQANLLPDIENNIQEAALRADPLAPVYVVSLITGIGTNPDGKVGVEFGCMKLEGSKSQSEILKRCQECGQREKDKELRISGKEGLCPNPLIEDLLNDIYGGEPDSIFRITDQTYPENWVAITHEIIMKNDVATYLAAYHIPYHTNYQTKSKSENFLKYDPLGQLINSIIMDRYYLTLGLHNMATHGIYAEEILIGDT